MFEEQENQALDVEFLSASRQISVLNITLTESLKDLKLSSHLYKYSVDKMKSLLDANKKCSQQLFETNKLLINFKLILEKMHDKGLVKFESLKKRKETRELQKNMVISKAERYSIFIF